MPPIVSYLSVLAIFISAGVFGQDASHEALDRARAQLRSEIESGRVAGAVHLAVVDGKVLYLDEAGVSDIEDETPLKADTILRIYSMSKPITSVAAMTLFEQGKFELDDPVSKYIPAFAETTVLVSNGDSQIVPAKREITVRDVFRHTTGYSYGDGKLKEYYEREAMLYRPPIGMFPPDITIDKAAEALARIPALHHPGEQFTYGFNTDLLGRLIEIWSGKMLDEYLRQTIFVPLQMNDTGFSVPVDRLDRFASCHTWKNGKLAIVDKANSSPYKDGFVFLSGGGGLVSTVNDYAKFCQMMVDDGLFKGQRILKEETIKLMFTDQLNVAGFQFGLGFAIGEVSLGSGDHRQKAAVYSWGGYASTDFRLVPDKKLFQIFVRQQIPSSHDFGKKQIDIIYEAVQ